MSRLNVVVEGKTERQFVDNVLAPHLRRYEIYEVNSIQVGGGGSFGKALRIIRIKLRGDTSAYCTTMFDYYGLPSDYPGLDSDDCPPPSRLYDRIEFLETRLAQELGDPHRFIPYLQVHEFEALLYADVEVIDSAPRMNSSGESRINALRSIVEHFDHPELIDDGEETAPSKRLQELYPRYDKALHGEMIAYDIGLPRIRDACPHFDDWVEEIESLKPLTGSFLRA